MTAFFAPLLLARTLALAFSFLVTLRASVIALGVLKRAEDDVSPPASRRIEMAASSVEFGLATSILALVVFVLATDALSSSLDGAMCAYGVVTATPWGTFALAAALASSLANATWLALHRVDLATRTPVLTRSKLAALALVLPLAALDLAGHIAFATTLDLSTRVACCTTTFDAGEVSRFLELGGAARNLLGGTELVLVIASIALAARTWRSMSAFMLRVQGAVGILAAIASLAAIVFVVAPYTYETPGHTCPFCLFTDVGHHLGWPLFSAWWLALALSVASLALSGAAKLKAVREDATRPLRHLAAALAIAWTIVLVASTFPVVTYVASTGARLI